MATTDSRNDPHYGTLSPRDELLRVASRMFYEEGINAVGVDRVISRAGIARATLYRHFGGKEGLVSAYLSREDALIRSRFIEAEREAVSPTHQLELLINGIAEDAARFHTRGCPFINAAAEFPDESSAVRQVVTKHRGWFRSTIDDALRSAGRDDSAKRALKLVILRDGMLAGGCLDNASETRTAFVESAREIAGLA